MVPSAPPTPPGNIGKPPTSMPKPNTNAVANGSMPTPRLRSTNQAPNTSADQPSKPEHEGQPEHPRADQQAKRAVRR